MNKVFENNIKALATLERNAELAGDLLKADDMSSFAVAEVEGKNVLFSEMNGENILLDSLYPSSELMELFIKNINSNSIAPTFMIFGLGNGMYVRQILDSGYSESIICVVEPDIANMKFILSNFELNSILANERVLLCTLDMLLNDRNYEILNAVLPYKKINDGVYMTYPNYAMLYPNEVREYNETVQMYVSKSIASMNVIARLGNAFCKNALNNMRLVTKSKSVVDLAKRIPEGIPAVIVSSGPSVDKNVDFLKDAKDRCLIIAADSALSVLLKHEIIPDLFISVDAKKSAKHFADDRVKDIPMVMTVQTNITSAAGQRSPIFFTKDSNEYISKFFDDNNVYVPTLYSGGSVANDAASLCAQLGIRTLIFIGQDLAYTDNKTHSADSLRGTWNRDVSTFTNNTYVKGYYGGEVLSSAEFVLYINWFEDFFANNKEYMTFINATEGGANIEGAVNMPFKAALDKYCIDEYYKKDVFTGCTDLLNDELKSKYEKYCDDIYNQLSDMKTLVRNGRRDYEKLKTLAIENKLGKGEARSIIERTAKISYMIENEPVMTFVHDKIQEFTNEMIRKTDKKFPDVRTEIIKTSEAGYEYLGQVAAAIDEILEDR